MTDINLFLEELSKIETDIRITRAKIKTLLAHQKLYKDILKNKVKQK